MRLTWVPQAWVNCASRILVANDWREEVVRSRSLQAWRGLVGKILVLSYRVAASRVLDIVLARTPTMVNCMRALARSDDLAWQVASAAMMVPDPPDPIRGRTAFMKRCDEKLHRSDVAAEGSWTEDLKLELEAKIAELEDKVKSLEEAPEEAEQRETLHPGARRAASSSSTPPTNKERWATAASTVERSWTGYPTPWWCAHCGAEWCRVRNLPGSPGQAPLDTPWAPARPPADSPGWV